jgi:PhnB protein
MSEVKKIPDGYRTLTPFLSLKEAAKAIEFYQKAFDAQLVERHDTDDGRIMHAVMQIGDSLVMLADEFPEYGCGITSPQQLKGSSVLFHLYVEDVDAAFDKAVKAGAKVNMPVADMFWGDRYGQLEDPFGHHWSIATHIADFSTEEIEQGAKQCCKDSSCHS